MFQHPTPLRALGFCGIDDSVSPGLLSLISAQYPLVEWGVLFRPDLEGTPRYATMEWVKNKVSLRRHAEAPAESANVAQRSLWAFSFLFLTPSFKLHPAFLATNGAMRLAAHLCGARVNEVLNGEDAFLQTLSSLGFKRVQINATAVNGVDTTKLTDQVPVLADVIRRNPQLEFIIQRSAETSPLWEPLLTHNLANVSNLFDESKGTGTLLQEFVTPPTDVAVGYAGGLGPANIAIVLPKILAAAKGSSVWIDMESSLRSTLNGADVFDVYKCYEVIEKTAACGLMKMHTR